MAKSAPPTEVTDPPRPRRPPAARPPWRQWLVRDESGVVGVLVALVLSNREMWRLAEPVLSELGLDVPPHVRAETLPLADRQLLEICRALLQKPRGGAPTAGLRLDALVNAWSWTTRPAASTWAPARRCTTSSAALRGTEG